MAKAECTLRYLPLFYEDLEEKVVYIIEKLKKRQYPYYRIYADDFVIYYVVVSDEDKNKVMEVRRFLYKGQNREDLL